MGRKSYERISQREYGRRLVVSNETIRKAIEAGKINKGWDAKEKKILFEKANEEWGNIYLKPDEGVQEVISHLDKVLSDQKNSQGSKDAKIKNSEAKDTEAEAIAELENFNLNSKTPFAEALRVEKVAKAKVAELEMKEKIGELVNKDIVYKELFKFGQEVRQAVLAVADRCIDSVIAAPNRSESHNILTKELHAALEKLTNPNLDFQPR